MNVYFNDGINAENMIWNWDNKMRAADETSAARTISIKYEPDGNLFYREATVSGQTRRRKYIVDTTGKVPRILLVLDPDDGDRINRNYIYIHNQVIAQHDGDHTADIYFYLHDRLGSVRMLMDEQGQVVNFYTYDPFGNVLEIDETVDNRLRFAGYYWDEIANQYYCTACWHDPHIARFSSRDPVRGHFTEPMTLHAYLYCLNDPVNKTYLTGEI